ncbi:FAD-dependent oxidoreductase [Robbsia sp. Bb-Pol-6]|uniref:FAD-dependent oxidoreductase n=1 Tax=Robbsia betulipollinis TaxID=2981849 RepID=A0ABT3ZQG3_9BURK|nr:FAD-dependent oxidoreductase [Robbsia betulipollinis]MCY0388128.1 FAD-dependent oxidoreductase [Robbsia betulipollinis]
MEQLDLIVIGAGISGVAIATAAANAGWSVAVVEQHATVAQGASFAHGGLVLPAPFDPWFGPGPRMPEAGGLPWRRKAHQRQADDAGLAAWQTLAALSRASRGALTAAATTHALEFEARDGGLYLFRTQAMLERAGTLAAALREAGLPSRTLDAGACRATEPSLAHTEELAGAVAFDDMLSGNCALAAKQLKTSLASRGVAFHTMRQAVAIHPEAGRVGVDTRAATDAAGAFAGVHAIGFASPLPAATPSHTGPRDARRDSNGSNGIERLYARRVVIAAGTGTTTLLAGLGLSLPTVHVATRSLTGTILREENAPRRMLVDAERGVGIVRFEQRLRVGAALARRGGETLSVRQAEGLAELLHDCAEHRVAGVVRLSAAPSVCEHVLGADGQALVGPLPTARGRRTDAGEDRVFIMLAGNHRGWGLAFGAAQWLMHQMRGEAPDEQARAMQPGRFL